MTTAHRPTWKAAVGKAQEGGWTAGGARSTLRSVLEEPSHTTLKTRSDAPTKSKREEILQKSLLKLRQMEEKSGRSVVEKRRVMDEEVEKEGRQKLLMATADVDEVQLQSQYDDKDKDIDEGKKSDGWSDVDDVGFVEQESDLDASDSEESDEDDSDDDDDDSEDEEAALQAELAKIRAEREAAKAKADALAEKEEKSHMEEAALVGNPLLATENSAVGNNASGRMKRRWNDDVVFRNQAKGEPDQNKKRFINDTVRNDFHKRFLNKFIK